MPCPHTAHTKGFSRVCVLWCERRCDCELKVHPHSLTHKAFPLCVSSRVWWDETSCWNLIHTPCTRMTALCLNRFVFWLKSSPCSPNSTVPALSRTLCTSPELVLWAQGLDWVVPSVLGCLPRSLWMVPGVSEGKPEKSPSHLYSQTRVENLLFLYFLCPRPVAFIRMLLPLLLLLLVLWARISWLEWIYWI